MNERQAAAQNTLSEGRALGQDSSSLKKIQRRNRAIQEGVWDEEDERNFDIKSEYNEDGEIDDKKISKSTFIAMIVVGLILDTIAILPVLGWLFSTIVLILIYISLGVKFHIRNVLKFGACDVIKLIPLISVFPAFVLSIFLNLGPMIEGVDKLVDSVPGGEMVNQVSKVALRNKK